MYSYYTLIGSCTQVVFAPPCAQPAPPGFNARALYCRLKPSGGLNLTPPLQARPGASVRRVCHGHPLATRHTAKQVSTLATAPCAHSSARATARALYKLFSNLNSEISIHSTIIDFGPKLLRLKIKVGLPPIHVFLLYIDW